MAPSFTSIERGNPPTRRRSCLACTRSRRRCDQARPACQRCSQRRIACEYPHGTTKAAKGSSLGHEPSPTRFDELRDHYPLARDVVLEEPIGDFISQELYDFLDNEPCDAGDADNGSRVSTTAKQALQLCRPISEPRVSRAITSRLQYTMDKISAAPAQMVLENRTPWCHVRLYDNGMPRSMQYAVSSAALHAAKNDINARVIWDNMESRVQDLLSSPPRNEPLEILGYAQAILIFQVLRLTDNDPRSIFSYEATMPHLEEAASALLPHTEFHEFRSISQSAPMPDPLPLYPVTAARDFWEAWIFQESARRTLGIIAFFVLTYRYVKGHNTCHQNAKLNRSVTLSAPLWNAGDPVEFAVTWMSKSHFVVHADKPDRLVKIMDHATAEDIDDWGRICLTAMMGMDEAKGWLAMRGVML